jgi:catechol 2,3-dioxygenase-like lactoylglutathione lyase family enzyme
MKCSTSNRQDSKRMRRALVPACLLLGIFSNSLSALADLPSTQQPQSSANAEASSSDSTSTHPSAATLKKWRADMARVPLPSKGCFRSSHPSTRWERVSCTTAPLHPYRPSHGNGPKPVGNTIDFSGQVSAGTSISAVAGTFDMVEGVTSETDTVTGNTNTYSLQLNTQNGLSTATCKGGSVVCSGEQQFIYSNTGSAFIQYWLERFLLGAPKKCPDGWQVDFPHCFRNSTNAVSVPVQPITNLAELGLMGKIDKSGTDTVIFSAGTRMYSATGDNSLGLGTGWTMAEFNILGDLNSSQAAFNSGTTFVVRTQIDNGTTNAPACLPTGFTLETNNLTLASPCCPYGGASPAIVFTQTNISGASPSCINGTSQQALTNVGSNSAMTSWIQLADEPHVVYVSTSQHLPQVWYLLKYGTWSAQDLTTLVPSELARSSGPLTSWVQSDGPHIAYADPSGNIYQLWYLTKYGTWSTQTLMSVPNAAPVGSESPMTSWVQSDGPHIAYADPNGNVYQLWYTEKSGNWAAQSLMNVPGAAPVGAGSPMTSWVQSDGPHIAYADPTGNVYQLWYTEKTGNWAAQTLMNVPNAAPVGGRSPMTSWVQPDGPHIAYADPSGNVFQLWYTEKSGNWAAQTLMTVPGAATVGAGSPMTSWVQSDGPHIAYADPSGNVFQLWYTVKSGNWAAQSLMNVPGAARVGTGSPMTSWVQSDGPHVAYADPSGNLNQLWYLSKYGKWLAQSLSGIPCASCR